VFLHEAYAWRLMEERSVLAGSCLSSIDKVPIQSGLLTHYIYIDTLKACGPRMLWFATIPLSLRTINNDRRRG
jgi:hypothetical protein